MAAADVSSRHSELAHVHAAQALWAATHIRTRLQFVHRLRDGIACHARELLPLLGEDSLTAEVIPLADACRFLERAATGILAPEKVSSHGRPFWFRKVNVDLRREPHGVVLVIGPANYPLFLPGVQVLQALVAGNAVLVKPGAGGAPAIRQLHRLALEAGLPHNLFTVLDEDREAAADAIRAGVDKIVITGSLQSGQAVLYQAAGPITPVTAELSGLDPVFVLESADLEKAAAGVAFGIELNAGHTCIAPRRVFVHSAVAASFRKLLSSRSRNLDAMSPVLRVSEFTELDSALHIAAESRYALGASVFGEEDAARRVADKICAGVVVINDIIVPTADPRVPFGGRKQSGFGKTRGAEGLREMTAIKAVVVQRAKRLRHLEPLPRNAEQLFLSFLEANHRSGWKDRVKGWIKVCKAARQTQAEK